MTVPKITTYHARGSRFYVHPESDEKVPGVTSVLGMLPKPFLKAWAAKVVATEAVESQDAWLPLAKHNPEGAIEYLKKAPDRFTKGAADVGTDAHGIFEALAKGETLGRLTPALQVYADHYREFLDAFQPEFLHIEDTVWSETHGYAGSFDWIAKIDGEVVIGDNKTTRSGVHEEVALQLAAYKHADYLLDVYGDRADLPVIEAGAVFHVRPEGWNLYPVRVDGEVFSYFLTLLTTFAWDKGAKRGVIGKPIRKPEAAA